VESSVSTVDAGVRPWRTATLVAATFAVVELVALLAIGGVFLGPAIAGWVRSDTARTTRAPTPERRQADTTAPSPAPPQLPLLPRGETSVLILNGNGVAGAAASKAEAVREKQYVVAAVGNAPRSDYARSVVMFRPGNRGEAARLARDLGIRIVSPLDGLRASQLMGAHVAVIIGSG